MDKDKFIPTRPQDYPFFHEAKYSTFQNAAYLRKSQTEAERILWEQLRGRKLNNLKFRRQHSIYLFIADFYCHELKLVIELDGSIHHLKEVAQYDEYREKLIQEFGLKVLRFSNDEVLKDLESVLHKIIEIKSLSEKEE
ncbi:MAG: endonuclease domain-containing protein [Spirosomataceae bacterium]